MEEIELLKEILGIVNVVRQMNVIILGVVIGFGISYLIHKWELPIIETCFAENLKERRWDKMPEHERLSILRDKLSTAHKELERRRTVVEVLDNQIEYLLQESERWNWISKNGY